MNKFINKFYRIKTVTDLLSFDREDGIYKSIKNSIVYLEQLEIDLSLKMLISRSLADGNYLNPKNYGSPFITSHVTAVEDDSDKLTVYTNNSIYYFVACNLSTLPIFNPEEMDKRFMNNDELFLVICNTFYYGKFGYGVFKSSDQFYEVRCALHIGMFQDSILFYSSGILNLDLRFFINIGGALTTYKWSKNISKIHFFNPFPYTFTVIDDDREFEIKPGAMATIHSKG